MSEYSNSGFTDKAWSADWEDAWKAAEADGSAQYTEVPDEAYAQALAETDAQRYGTPQEDTDGFDYGDLPEAPEE